MEKPEIKKFPTEIFGYAFCDHSPQAKEALDNQYCPYLDGECKKPRKSEPSVKVGVCSVGYKGFAGEYLPVIVCPHRFNVPAVFNEIQEQYLKEWDNIEWVTEVSIGVGGSIDFVAVNRSKEDAKIKDFLCVEFQAAGTTGTPWQAVLDFKRDRRFSTDNYKYGINWANEFVKTMMQQVFKKGKIIQHWRRKIIFVIQDIGLEYIRTATDASGLRPANDDDPIHFCAFGLAWSDNGWIFRPVERVSTDIDGVSRILGGALSEEYPSVEKFIANIERKARSKK
ncbi:MAG: NotI family restriction endonuclease [Chloroherpetonaceae bacterium]|nr:NotI family restriction endonuclease [Chloroherpetonaceae bacterium]